MMNKAKITFVVPEKLQQDLRKQIIADNYSMRDKSRWITEAINDLLALENYEDLVNFGDEFQGFQKLETIVVPLDIKRQMDTAIITIRRTYPALEGIQSRIIRTSILQRLIRS